MSKTYIPEPLIKNFQRNNEIFLFLCKAKDIPVFYKNT